MPEIQNTFVKLTKMLDQEAKVGIGHQWSIV